MANSTIGYKNLLETGTVTASTEATGFEKENAFDWRPFTWWQPTAVPANLTVDMGSAVTADYFALAAHDLFDNSASIKLQYSSDNFAADTNDAFTAITPTDNDVIFKTFTQQTARYWRVLVTGGVSSLGVVSFGDKTDLTVGMRSGFAPPTLNRDSRLLTNESSSGQFLGRSVERRNYPGTINLTNLAPAWVRSTFDPLVDHTELKPFFFSWDDTNFSGEAVFAWMQGSARASYQDETYMTATIQFNGNK